MAWWLTVYCRKPISGLTPEQLTAGIAGRDPEASAGDDYLTLAEGYDVDEALVKPALRALATDGIQKGHMALHARAVAVAAGATGPAVERVAQMIVEARDITVEAARRALSIVQNEADSAASLDGA